MQRPDAYAFKSAPQDRILSFMRLPENSDHAALLVEALDALRDLTTRAHDAYDHAVADDGSVDTWQSDGLKAAIERAEAVIAWAQTTAP